MNNTNAITLRHYTGELLDQQGTPLPKVNASIYARFATDHFFHSHLLGEFFTDASGKFNLYLDENRVKAAEKISLCSHKKKIKGIKLGKSDITVALQSKENNLTIKTTMAYVPEEKISAKHVGSC